MDDDLVLNFNSNEQAAPKKAKTKTNDRQKEKAERYLNKDKHFSKPKASEKKEFLSKKRFNKEDKNSKDTDNEKEKNSNFNKPKQFNNDTRRKYEGKKPFVPHTKKPSEYIKQIEDSDLPDIEMKKDTNFNPFSAKTFTDLNLSEFLLKQLTKHNYDQLTKIQKQAIPVMLEHKNVVIKSETGTGKTLAYVVPLYQLLIKLHQTKPINRKDGVYAIIFAPTHELCLQIESTVSKLNSCCISVVNGTLIGGQKIEIEKSKIRKGINIIICTPGRLLYHLKNTQTLNFSNLNYIIFDEADTLLDMGFEKDIKECLRIVCTKSANKEFTDVESFKKFKIFLLSATIDSKIRAMTSFLMKGFKSVGFKSEKEKKQTDDSKGNEEGVIELNEDQQPIETPSNLRQFVSVVYDEFRLLHLLCFLYCQKSAKIIVFVNNCDSADFHADLVQKIKLNNLPLFEKINIWRIHGKMKHPERLVVFNDFNKQNKNCILFATDVIARGLDFPNVEWIIHYDVNPDKKDYLNRMGRTARLTSSGNSLLFLMCHEEPIRKSCLSSFTFEDLDSSSMLLRFVKDWNAHIAELNLAIKNPEEQHFELTLNSMDWKSEIEVNEEYRKKLSYIIYPLIGAVKEYLHSEESRVGNARKSLKCSLRAYTTYRKYDPSVFNLNTLHLTRYARAFGLYKESLKYKLDDQEYRVDQRSEVNRTKSEKKFQRAQKKMEISEFI